MSRLPDATVRLAELIRNAQGRRFNWRSWNCCIFAARAMHALDGHDPRASFPRFRNKAEAEAIIASCGGLEGLTRKALADYEQIHPSLAGFGDIVLHDFGRGLQPAVCVGVRCLAPGRRGPDWRMTLDAVAAWKI